jgi:hypothetical protein
LSATSLSSLPAVRLSLSIAFTCAPRNGACPDPVGVTAHYCFKSFSCNTYGSPRKCCKQKTYGLANSFRCNTYKKQREGVQLLLTRIFDASPCLRRADIWTFRRQSDLSPFRSNSCALSCTFLHSRKTQLFSFHAIAHSASKNEGARRGGRSRAAPSQNNVRANRSSPLHGRKDCEVPGRNRGAEYSGFAATRG